MRRLLPLFGLLALFSLVALFGLVALGCDGAPAPHDASTSDDVGGARDAGADGAAALDAPGDAPGPGGDAPGPDSGADDASFVTTDAATDDTPRDAAPRCPVRETRGLFVWSDDFDVRRDEILALAEGAGVTELYLHANRVYAGDLSEDVLASWIAAAHARCLEVELLFGNARWIPTAGHGEATARVTWSVAFAAAHPDAQPDGVHFDLEPQQLSEWTSGDRGALVAQLVDVLEVMTPEAEAAGLPLSVDIGFFLDGVDVTRGPRTRAGSEWITDAVSRLVIMDYRDTAENVGHGGMIDLAATELAYATSVGVPVVLAAETTAQDPTYVSFHEEGRAALLRELDLVRAHYGDTTSLEGFAIHDEDGLASLGP